MKTMTTRERFKAIANFQPFDRLMVLEWAGWWDETINRWHKEGLPENITDAFKINEYLGLDLHRQNWIYPLAENCPQPKSHGSGIITNMKEYEEVLPHLYPDYDLGGLWTAWAKEQETGNVVLWFSLDGFFWFPRRLLGIENHLYALYDKPDLIHRINSDLSKWQLKMINKVCQYCIPDFMTFAEDMSYNKGSMLSEELFNKFMKPYYDKVIPIIKKNGIIPIVDSDGDITEPAYWFENTGLQGILPLERQAGCDINKLREEHPNMVFVGHFDKMTMNQGEEVMRREFERLLPAAEKGGFFPACDHQTPPGVSFEDYKIYLKLFREYAEKAG